MDAAYRDGMTLESDGSIMIRNQKIAAALSVALAFGVVAVSMWVRHDSKVSTARTNRAEISAKAIDDEAITKVLRENHVDVSGLTVRSVGDVVILRGTGTAASKDQAGTLVKALGVGRVANLISSAPAFDDEAIRRDAERELASVRSLDGCLLKVACEKGVISVTGTVQHELQKDAARAALRSVSGAKEVRVDLSL